MEYAEFKPLVSFPDASPSFVHGFEAGMVWQRMQDGEATIDRAIPYHIDNSSVFERMAEAAGYEIHVNHLGGDLSEWCEVVFTKLPPPRAHLRVV